jgi:hypothetical protein
MNCEADHYASSAQRHVHQLPTAPIPTFFVDEFTFYTREDGWIESNIRDYTAKSHIRTLAAASNHQRMALQLYVTKPPPESSYTHAYSAYSAVVQLYTRSGQLPTADVLYSRVKLETPLCRLGCKAIEDQHHIFVDAHDTRRGTPPPRTSSPHERTTSLLRKELRRPIVSTCSQQSSHYLLMVSPYGRFINLFTF